jgi:hypothetical protein
MHPLDVQTPPLKHGFGKQFNDGATVVVLPAENCEKKM